METKGLGFMVFRLQLFQDRGILWDPTDVVWSEGLGYQAAL